MNRPGGGSDAYFVKCFTEVLDAKLRSVQSQR